MADGVDERLTALEQEVQRLKARLDVSERDRQSDLAELHSDIARLRAEMAGGLSDVKKDMGTIVRRLGAIETQLGAIEAQLDDWPDNIGQLVREIIQETMRKP
jgi:uncharacterized small protein (DUF1192 family)